MADDTKTTTKNDVTDGKAAGSDTSAAPAATAKAATGNDASDSQATASVQVVALHPIYYQPGMPPHRPGALLSVCVVTARNWLAAGLIRLVAGESLPAAPAGETGDYPVFPKSGQPAAASQV